MSKQIVVLTGMHRSGTSLIASLLQSAGLHIGSELLPPDPRNPRGFFEDVGFYEFHQRALIDRGTTPYVGPDFVFEATSAELDKAARLVAERAAFPLWGWKDPRTSLFLDFWREMLPEARFLLVYRHPLEVLLSLVRRVEAHTVGLLEALTTWTVYNSRILAFRQKHPEASLLCHTYAAVERADDLGRLLSSKCGGALSFGASTVEGLYHSEELRRLPLTPALETVLHQIHPDSAALYESLEAAADLPEPRRQRGPRAADGLEPLSRALTSFPRPHPPTRVRGLLLLLLGALDPELVERYFGEHGRYILDLERDRGQLEGQANWIGVQEANIRAKQEWIERQEEAIRNQKAWIELLEGDKRAQEDLVDRLKGHLESREAELRAVYGSLSWRVGRRLAESAPGRLLAPLFRRPRPQVKEEPVVKPEERPEERTYSASAFEAELPAGELERILQRVEENLAFRRILKAGEGERGASGPAVPTVPPLASLDERQQRLRRLRAPFFVPEGGGLGALLRRLVNLPLRAFGHKQVQFNEQVLELTTYLAASFHQSLTDQRNALVALAEEVKGLREEIRRLPERRDDRPDAP